MKYRRAVITILLAVSFLLSGFGPVLAGPVGNDVVAGVIRGHFYFTDADSVDNLPVQWNNWWLADTINTPDGGTAVVNPRVRFETKLPLSDFRPSDPAVFTADPASGVYNWNFAGVQVAEPAHLPVTAFEGTSTERPRFSLSRSVEPEILAATVTTQTITAVFKLEEPLPPEVTTLGFTIGSPVYAYNGYRLVVGKFVSQTQIDRWSARTDGVQASWYTQASNLEVGKTYTFQAALQAVKSPDLIGSPVFKPEAIVMYFRAQNFPKVTGNSVTVTAGDVGTITFSSDNPVDWSPNYSDFRYQFHLRPVVSKVSSNKPPFYVQIPADVRIEPETLSLKSEGVVNAFVTLPAPYQVKNIDVSTVTLQGAKAISGVAARDTLALKFKGNDLQYITQGEQVEFRMRGNLKDGTEFHAKSFVRVIP